MKNSFLSALAGWLAGALTFAIVGERLSHWGIFGLFLIALLYGAAFILPVWLALLWPLYVLTPARSLLWRPGVCVPVGALAGALLYFGVVGSTFDWRAQTYFSTLHVLVGAITGAATCGVGCALRHREIRAA